MGGGSRSQSQPSRGILLQRFTNKRVMHCSHYRQPGHRVSKYPTREVDTTTDGQGNQAESAHGNEEGKTQENEQAKAQEKTQEKAQEKAVEPQ